VGEPKPKFILGELNDGVARGWGTGVFVDAEDGCDAEENAIACVGELDDEVSLRVMVGVLDIKCPSGGVICTSAVLFVVEGFAVGTTSLSTIQDSTNFRADSNAAIFSLKALRVASEEVVVIKGRGLADENRSHMDCTVAPSLRSWVLTSFNSKACEV